LRLWRWRKTHSGWHAGSCCQGGRG
jgi:hypothetical protein